MTQQMRSQSATSSDKGKKAPGARLGLHSRSMPSWATKETTDEVHRDRACTGGRPAPGWRERLGLAADAKVTVRIETEEHGAAVAAEPFHTDDPAFGIWRDRDDGDDVEAYLVGPAKFISHPTVRGSEQRTVRD